MSIIIYTYFLNVLFNSKLSDSNTTLILALDYILSTTDKSILITNILNDLLPYPDYYLIMVIS